jgi:uncharacterized protein YabN with tetrapyrrole methylase and pyrophosphatase domain
MTNNKFIRRFSYIENKVKEKGKEWKKVTLEELNQYWDESKVLYL